MMQKQMLQGANWKKPEEKIVLSHLEALKLLNEVGPHVAGTWWASIRSSNGWPSWLATISRR
jgi:hypothetical protein